MKLTKIALGALVLYVAMIVVACDDSTSAKTSDSKEGLAPVASGTSSSAGETSSPVPIGWLGVSSSSLDSSASAVSSSSVLAVHYSSSSFTYASCNPKPNWEYLDPDVEYDEMVDARDEQVYKTVKIGDQVWMAENLNYSKNRNACNKELYGNLYSWQVAMNAFEDVPSGGCGFGYICTPTYPVQGICPSGWHLPSVEEWEVLFKTVGEGETSNVGNRLKSKKVFKGEDTHGFSAIPNGYYYKAKVSGTSDFFFWTSTEKTSRAAYNVYWVSGADYVSYNYQTSRGALEKDDAIGVRCVKD